ncbi:MULTISPECIES: DUF6266 family protein [Butyricimonas]|uniref:DUF6266 family protein n=1 Tax=Butyricimonas TaxID=574697 RepID=UPI001D072385|nr:MULTISPECIES: DUF6266 family protein [Butyricimonas]MCB6971341.1 DUF6266 family protein [Butyricimonas synergistica]MCG4518055.1 DUF6266 family protein [Butyricimonas sp. DFI.6.44]
MAKVYLDYLGALIGSVGKVSYYMRYSDNIARRKGEERKVSNAPALVEQRQKFGMLAHLSTVLQPAIELGFPQRKRGQSARNAFHQLNKDVCTVEGEMVVVDYENLLCSNGSLVPPDVTVSFDAVAGKFSFVQEQMEEEEMGCNADDAVRAVLLECEKGFCRLVRLRKRGEGGSTSVALPKNWNGDNVVVYCFAVSADGKKASTSLYLTVEAGS